MTHPKHISAIERLRARQGLNKYGNRVSDKAAADLLAAYLDEAHPTSYRKLAAQHGISVGAVVRAVHRAAAAAVEPAAALFVLLLLCINGWGAQ